MNRRIMAGAILLLTGCAMRVPIKTTPISQRAVATLTIPGSADFLATHGDEVWVTNRGRIEKLRVGSNTPVATAVIPQPCGGMVVAFGSLWVASCADLAVYRVDPDAGTIVAVIPTGLADPTGELSLAAGDGSIWVLTDARGALSRIDPGTNAVIATVNVAPGSFAVAYGFDAAWITTTEAGSVQRIDPKTNKVAATIVVGPTPRFLAAGEGGVWTLNQGDGTVSRIDPATNRVAATIDADVAGPGGDIASGAGRVWVRATPVLLTTIDPVTNAISERFGPAAGSGAVRVGDTLVWVTAHDTQQVWALRAIPQP